AIGFGAAQLFGAEAGGGNGKDFGADFDKATEQDLLLLEFRTVLNHGVEERTGKPAAGARSVAEGAGQLAGQTNLSKLQACAQRHPLFWIPPGVKKSGFEGGAQPLGYRQLRIEDRGTDFQMRIERFASDKKSHDFARTLKNGVDAAIAKES